jgi:hypothetical protein
MKTDASRPLFLRTEAFTRENDTKKRGIILEKFGKKIQKLIKDMTKITAEGNAKESKLISQLTRLAQDKTTNETATKQINDTIAKIKQFREEVARIQQGTTQTHAQP